MSLLIKINFLLINSFNNFRKITTGGVGDLDGPDNISGNITINPESNLSEKLFSSAIPIFLVTIFFLIFLIIGAIGLSHNKKEIIKYNNEIRKLEK